jgi:hypothetical protein
MPLDLLRSRFSSSLAAKEKPERKSEYSQPSDRPDNNAGDCPA